MHTRTLKCTYFICKFSDYILRFMDTKCRMFERILDGNFHKTSRYYTVMTDGICMVEYVYNHLFCYLLQVNPPAPHSHLLSHDEDTTWTLYFQLLTLFAEFLLVFFF